MAETLPVAYWKGIPAKKDTVFGIKFYIEILGDRAKLIAFEDGPFEVYGFSCLKGVSIEVEMNSITLRKGAERQEKKG